MQLSYHKNRDAVQMDGVPCLGGEEKLPPSHIYIVVKLFISLTGMAKSPDVFVMRKLIYLLAQEFPCPVRTQFQATPVQFVPHLQAPQVIWMLED
jgi:hypothetical protein